MWHSDLAALRIEFSFDARRLDQTPLHYCALGNNKHVLQTLLDAGADVAAKNKYERGPVFVMLCALESHFLCTPGLITSFVQRW